MERIDYSQLIQYLLKQHLVNDVNKDTEIQLLFDQERL